MLFGLTNAPAVFQSLINDVLRDMLSCFVFIYLDDILIFSKDPKVQRHHVSQVLERLLQNRLFAKAEKCEFPTPFSSLRPFGPKCYSGLTLLASLAILALYIPWRC